MQRVAAAVSVARLSFPRAFLHPRPRPRHPHRPRMFAAPADAATFFASNPLDRLHLLRTEHPDDALAAALASHAASGVATVPFVGERALLRTGALATIPGDALAARLNSESFEALALEHADQIIVLGQHVRSQELYCALDVNAIAKARNMEFKLEENETAGDVRRVLSSISGEDAGIMAHARALLGWHSKHQFCSQCGAATRIAEGGGKRVCITEPEKHQHFPRTDPVAICLVWRGERCLLGRQASWPRGRYSCLAGFVDAAETFEQAAAREAHEEAGVAVRGVRYFKSQPWPNYSQLMLGGFAEAESERVRLNDRELEDARWFTRDEIRAALAKPEIGFLDEGDGELALPGSQAIARDLIVAWLEGKHLQSKV